MSATELANLTLQVAEMKGEIGEVKSLFSDISAKLDLLLTVMRAHPTDVSTYEAKKPARRRVVKNDDAPAPKKKVSEMSKYFLQMFQSDESYWDEVMNWSEEYRNKVYMDANLSKTPTVIMKAKALYKVVSRPQKELIKAEIASTT